MAKLVFIDDNIVDHRIFQYLAEKYYDSAAITYTVRPDAIIDYIEEHLAEEHLLPDVIFVDLRMRGFDGYDFLNSYSQLHKRLHKEISIYVISFSVHPKDLNLMVEYPFIKKYLLKPLSDAQLKHILAPAS